MISNTNFMGLAVEDIPKDDEYVRCNFMRRSPDKSGAQPVGVRLFPGDDTHRIFRNCNLMNCEVPPGSTVINSNTFIAENHVPTEVDRIIVDGVPVSTRQRTKLVHYGKWTPQGYEYEPVPIERDNL